MAFDGFIMGVFTDDLKAAAAIEAVKKSPFTLHRVHGPIPSHKVSEALGLKKSPVGYFTLVGGVLGFFLGFALAAYTAVEWNLIVSGKPIVAWVPFFIVGFEFTILFAVLANVVGFLIQSRLPRLKIPETYDPRCSGTHFGILSSCRLEERGQLTDLFRENGGEISTLTL